jgi:O-antigen/teichoic acid export membrane protein
MSGREMADEAAELAPQHAAAPLPASVPPESPPRLGFVVRVFGSAVATQALLSAASFAVGLILIRRTSDVQYGYYVLVTNAVLLLVSLQGAFIQPQLVTRMYGTDVSGRAELIGGLYRDQRRVLLWLAVATLLIAPLLLILRLVNRGETLVLSAAAIAVVAALHREFFRMVLLGHRLSDKVLRADAIYVALLVTGALLATLSPAPAATAALTLAMAACIGGLLCARTLWRFEHWNRQAAPGLLKALAPLGTWSALGAGVYWIVSQGYNYLVAGLLSVSAVAAIAATRLTVMPIGLLSTGVGTIMLPTTARWLNAHGPGAALRRLVLFALALTGAAALYFAVLWSLRNWIFAHVLKKQIPHRDALLLLWGLVATLGVLRDQFIYLLTVRHRFRLLTTIAMGNAAVSLSVAYLSIRHLGIVGVLVGLLVGEALNVVGLIVLSIREVRIACRVPAV